MSPRPVPKSRAAPRASIAEIRAMLEDRALDVAQHYAPPAPGSYLHQGGWWTLNPGRLDRSVGSFVVWVSGPRRGRWSDFATGAHGDLIDLIGLAYNLPPGPALLEARRFLGLGADTPEAAAHRARALELARQRRAKAEADEAHQRARKARAALALWLAGEERLRDTPVAAYLARRGIDLGALGRQPRVLRYAPALPYDHTDRETGEVFEGRFPAMLALITGPDGQAAAVHRTWLAEDGRGWGKAPVPEPKKVYGPLRGGSIHLWAGAGPKGGKAAPLRDAAPGSTVWLAEGIENALSVVVLLPEVRVLAGVSLSNLGAVALPPTVAEVVIVADNDQGDEELRRLDGAVAAHQAAGRKVRLWRPAPGFKDINDMLVDQLRGAGCAI